MDFKNYYNVLGVNREASTEEIRRAYRKLARRYHPDVSQEDDAEERFKEANEANEAYEMLKDAERRRAYDLFGASRSTSDEFKIPPGGRSNRNSRDFERFGSGSGSFNDFFDSIFGHGEAPGGPCHDRFRMSGSDRTVAAVITLEDSYFGRERHLDLAGSGVPARRLRIKVPVGVAAGQHIRLAAQGMAGYGGEPSGDLYLKVEFARHDYFRVAGRDILLLLPIAPWEAALGVTLTVPTLGGDTALTIAPGAQSGQKLSLAGRGLPGEPAGDQIVELVIRMPAVDSREKRELFERMRETMPFNPREAWPV